MPIARARPAALAASVFALLGVACAELPPVTVLPPPSRPAYDGYRSAKYADDRQWLCRPDLPGDRCHGDLTATEMLPDGSRRVVPHVPASAPKVDCFYVYPTVDMRLYPGNHLDFADVEPMASTTLAQAARFGEVCNVYAPLYRQVTIGTYVFGEAAREKRLAVAYSDVADAFAHYLGQYNHGRKIVVIGHSQGSQMVARLVSQFFESDPLLRERLLLAMPIGGWVEVPHGKTAGATFPTVPVCTRADETGCIVAFRTHRAGTSVSPGRMTPTPGDDTVCVNPVSVDRNERRPLSRTYFPATGAARHALEGIDGVTTPWVLYRDYYSAECVDGPAGYRYLAIAASPPPGDARVAPFDLAHPVLNSSLGTHILDLQFPQGDLIDMVARRAAQLP
jgi:hypothetical protein